MTLHEWIIKGEVGVSSKTMWAALTGAVASGSMGIQFDVPQDPDDFRRCRKLVLDCGVSTHDLQRVKEVFPWYAPYIDNWAKLNELWDLESPTGRCEKLYDYMQTLHDEAMILGGWERTGKNSWKRKTQSSNE